MIRAVNFLSRYQKDYQTNRKMLGPNIIANYELGAKMTNDFAWAHGEARPGSSGRSRRSTGTTTW